MDGDFGRVTRAEIVRAAREYIGTPFREAGREKGNGLGNDGLVLCVGEDLGLFDREGNAFRRTDPLDFSRLVEKPAGTKPRAGDVLAVQVPGLKMHAAIVSEIGGLQYMIHVSGAPPRLVVEHVISSGWQKRVIGSYEFPGVE